jgi:hypothetical protein
MTFKKGQSGRSGLGNTKHRIPPVTAANAKTHYEQYCRLVANEAGWDTKDELCKALAKLMDLEFGYLYTKPRAEIDLQGSVALPDIVGAIIGKNAGRKD